MASQACIVGAFEHPTRLATTLSTAELHAVCAREALADAGLALDDVDGYFGAQDLPGPNASWMVDFLNLRLRHLDCTDAGGCSYLIHLEHAAAAIDAGLCSVALITMGARPRSEGFADLTQAGRIDPGRPGSPWEAGMRSTVSAVYGMMARRHMQEFGTAASQLAAVRVAASLHAQHNPNAMYRKPVTVQDVLSSPIVASPLHRLDCCVVSDGGGSVVLARRDIARTLRQPVVSVRGCAHTVQTQQGGYGDLLRTGATVSGPMAFDRAGVGPQDIRYASIYDNFTIMVLLQLEDLGFCKKGEAGAFVAAGNLISGQGSLPWNTDGGGQCSNHPGHRGGMIRLLESVRQLRGEAHPAVQVPNCQLALVCGPGNVLGSGHGHATVILERE